MTIGNAKTEFTGVLSMMVIRLIQPDFACMPLATTTLCPLPLNIIRFADSATSQRKLSPSSPCAFSLTTRPYNIAYITPLEAAALALPIVQMWHRVFARSIRRRDMTKPLAQCRNSVFSLLARRHRPQNYSISRAPPPRLPDENPVVVAHLCTRGPSRALGTWHQWRPHIC